MPINLNKVFALHIALHVCRPMYLGETLDKDFSTKEKFLELSKSFKTYKFKDEAFKNSPPFMVLPIKETINFKAIETNDFSTYEKYLEDAPQDGHSTKSFIELEKSIKNLDNLKIKLIYSSETNSFLIIDGLHRTCVCIKNGLIKDKIHEENFFIYFDSQSIRKIKNELQKTLGANEETKSWGNRTEHGYHSFEIGNLIVKGQRRPAERLRMLRKFYDFKDKSVLDLGCNVGGMLFHLTEIKKGIGLDVDSRCIKCAEEIKNILKFDYELNFIKSDLNNPISINEKFDVAFLFSVGSWIKNWRGLYEQTLKLADTVFLETNNDQEGAAQLELVSNLGCKIKLINDNSKDDTTGNFGRKTYMLYK